MNREEKGKEVDKIMDWLYKNNHNPLSLSQITKQLNIKLSKEDNTTISSILENDSYIDKFPGLGNEHLRFKMNFKGIVAFNNLSIFLKPIKVDITPLGYVSSGIKEKPKRFFSRENFHISAWQIISGLILAAIISVSSIICNYNRSNHVNKPINNAPHNAPKKITMKSIFEINFFFVTL